jgi:hypothetical protein
LQDKYYRGINIGSTTDYRSHAVIVESYQQQKNSRVDNFIGYREIPLFRYREDLLVEILKEIGKYGRNLDSDPNFQHLTVSMNEWLKEEQSGDLVDVGFSALRETGNLLDKGFSTLGLGAKDTMGQEEKYRLDMGAMILGLNKKYRDEGWKDKQTEASAEHLRNFVKLFVERTGNNRDEVISCLGFLAGAYECGKFPMCCDFNQGYLKKLCEKPT